MNVALRVPRMTREAFLEWAAAQEERYEFDGWEPVLMTGGSMRHSRIKQNIILAMHGRLRGTSWRLFEDVAVPTIGNAARVPDVLVTDAVVDQRAVLFDRPVVVFEVISPTTARTDRFIKAREYAAVASIRRFVLVEQTVAGLTVFARAAGEAEWRGSTLTAEDTLEMPELGIAVPVAEFYADVTLDEG